MAFINNKYVFVSDEQISRSVEASEHPVEQGRDITDNVKRQPVSLSITGEIVGEDAAQTISFLTDIHHKGKLVKYSGRNVINNALIMSFNTGHTNEISGGCTFDMEIKEVRIAKSAYVAPAAVPQAAKTTKSGTQQIQNNTSQKTHTVKKGDTLWAIAKAYYGNGAQFTKIYEANKNKIKDPNLIYPNQVFVIP